MTEISSRMVLIVADRRQKCRDESFSNHQGAPCLNWLKLLNFTFKVNEIFREIRNKMRNEYILTMESILYQGLVFLEISFLRFRSLNPYGSENHPGSKKCLS